MEFQRINRSSPERIFIVAYNSYATASLTNGQVVSWDFDTDCDGVGVTKPSADHSGFEIAGVAAATIAAGAYGLVQVYGYHSAVRVRTLTSTSHTYHESRAAVAKGTPLAGNLTAVFCAEGIGVAATVQHLHPFAFALAAQASFTTKAIAAFIKAL